MTISHYCLCQSLSYYWLCYLRHLNNFHADLSGDAAAVLTFAVVAASMFHNIDKLD